MCQSVKPSPPGEGSPQHACRTLWTIFLSAAQTSEYAEDFNKQLKPKSMPGISTEIELRRVSYLVLV